MILLSGKYPNVPHRYQPDSDVAGFHIYLTLKEGSRKVRSFLQKRVEGGYVSEARPSPRDQGEGVSIDIRVFGSVTVQPDEQIKGSELRSHILLDKEQCFTEKE